MGANGLPPTTPGLTFSARLRKGGLPLRLGRVQVGPRPSKAPLICHAALSARAEPVVWKAPVPKLI
jgi:hypothetical protein